MAARLKQQAEKVGSAKTLKELRKTLPSLATAGVRTSLSFRGSATGDPATVIRKEELKLKELYRHMPGQR